jgi:hypothetical protein
LVGRGDLAIVTGERSLYAPRTGAAAYTTSWAAEKVGHGIHRQGTMTDAQAMRSEVIYSSRRCAHEGGHCRLIRGKKRWVKKSEALRKATHGKLYASGTADHRCRSDRRWITRAANFTVVIIAAVKGAALERHDNPDAYMLLLPPGVNAMGDA